MIVKLVKVKEAMTSLANWTRLIPPRCQKTNPVSAGVVLWQGLESSVSSIAPSTRQDPYSERLSCIFCNAFIICHSYTCIVCCLCLFYIHICPYTSLENSYYEEDSYCGIFVINWNYCMLMVTL